MAQTVPINIKEGFGGTSVSNGYYITLFMAIKL